MVKDILNDIMIEHKLTRKQLAEVIGVHETTIGQWILGRKKPSFDNIYQIYVKFGVTPNEIFDIDWFTIIFFILNDKSDTTF